MSLALQGGREGFLTGKNSLCVVSCCDVVIFYFEWGADLRGKPLLGILVHSRSFYVLRGM